MKLLNIGTQQGEELYADISHCGLTILNRKPSLTSRVPANVVFLVIVYEDLFLVRRPMWYHPPK